MLGNWSFGDYYKKEAIAWAWELLTDVWRLPKDRLYATCFQDDEGDVERDDEAANYWRQQPGIDPSHVLFFGRKDNFWVMADTGPCGPCSEIHLDRGEKYCDLKETPGHVCSVNGDCKRFLELWNLVFIQYNRLSPTQLEPLPSKHVDTGMGLERIVSVLQDVDSNYKTDLLSPLLDTIQQLTGHSDVERQANITPYRVIADHARAAAFLIADGVVPGNVRRNYICRMIIRRAARFGSKIRLDEPFLAKVAETAIESYGDFYPQLEQNRAAILDNLTREEVRFKQTVEGGIAKLDTLLDKVLSAGERTLAGSLAYDLYATYGLPLEITRDIAFERGMSVDEAGFNAAREAHKNVSGAGEAFGLQGGEDVDIYRNLLLTLKNQGTLDEDGVDYDPYNRLEVDGSILGIIHDGHSVECALAGEAVEVVLPDTCFYVESGGQVSDTGRIVSASEPGWEIRVDGTRKPAAGMVVHIGQVTRGEPRLGDQAIARVDAQRRMDIMRNHTATHLLHHELQAILGDHARQAGSLVAPDRLRFDFTHPEALTVKQLEMIEAGVNKNILGDYPLQIAFKPLSQAIEEGATALFGEKYGEIVRNITIGEPETFSNELCGGTHVDTTSDIGLFLILSEGSTSAGVRRIEAVTGRAAYELVQRRNRTLKSAAHLLTTNADEVPEKIEELVAELSAARKQNAALRRDLAANEFAAKLQSVPVIAGIPLLTAILPDADADTLRLMADRFRQAYPGGITVLASVQEGRPVVIAAISEELVKRGLNAGELVKAVAAPLGGGGGGKPTIATAGGKDASRLEEALQIVPGWVQERLGHS